MTSARDIRASWLAHLHSTTPADRARAESGVRRLYAAAGFPEPRHVVWYDSPQAAAWPVTLLAADNDRSLAPLLAPSSLSADDKRSIDAARAELGTRLGAGDWKATVAQAGALRLSTMAAMSDPTRLFGTAFINARFELSDDVSAMFKVPGDDDDLARAESHFIGGNFGVLRSAIANPAASALIAHPFYQEVSYSTMADDEKLVGNASPPALFAAAWDVAQSAGLWWPFTNAVFLTDRPSEIHVNARHVPHREDGPAIVYRDGWEIYAWNGKRVPKEWITATESVPPREYKGFDPTFVKWAKSKGSGEKPAKPAASTASAKAQAPGALSFLQRYKAGEHREVWKELVALGSAVREDRYAADATEVARETMRRVEQNVRTLVARLSAMNYQFMPDGPGSGASSGLFGLLKKVAGARGAGDASRAHVPPAPNADKAISRFESEYGTLPLSLRAFYEIVGEVNLNGTHPALDPKGNAVAPDPLIVYGLDEGSVEYDEDDEDGETPAAITIAPDDLHKANTSGGDPYTMAIPDLRADGELLDERHRLFFVDYLRLCFEYGGFPGYEGHSNPPAELQSLKAGLLDF